MREEDNGIEENKSIFLGRRHQELRDGEVGQTNKDRRLGGISCQDIEDAVKANSGYKDIKHRTT